MTPQRLPQEKAMRQQQMTRLIHSLPQLTHHQRQQLASRLQALMDRSQTSVIIEAHAIDGRACPHCASSRLVKNGSANGLQRFKCRQCRRTFNALGEGRVRSCLLPSELRCPKPQPTATIPCAMFLIAACAVHISARA